MSAPVIDLVLHAAIGFAAGLAVGLVHFGSLWWNAQMFARGRRLPIAFALQIGRFVLLVAVCIGLARLGALPLLAAALGLLVARGIILRRFGTVT